MMSWLGNTFCITGPWWGKSTKCHKILSQRNSNAELLSFVVALNKLLNKQPNSQLFKMLWRSCGVTIMHSERKGIPGTITVVNYLHNLPSRISQNLIIPTSFMLKNKILQYLNLEWIGSVCEESQGLQNAMVINFIVLFCFGLNLLISYQLSH